MERYVYTYLLGINYLTQSNKLYVKIIKRFRFLESHWFVWTTQMSHLPLPIEYDNQLSWFRSQLRTTCNVEQSTFNDWFSGHLNFQIEHQ